MCKDNTCVPAISVDPSNGYKIMPRDSNTRRPKHARRLLHETRPECSINWIESSSNHKCTDRNGVVFAQPRTADLSSTQSKKVTMTVLPIGNRPCCSLARMSSTFLAFNTSPASADTVALPNTCNQSGPVLPVVLKHELPIPCLDQIVASSLRESTTRSHTALLAVGEHA